MANWYAYICTASKRGYNEGEVCSYSTENLTTEQQTSRDIRKVSIGEWDDSGPDFKNYYFDLVTEKMLPISQ